MQRGGGRRDRAAPGSGKVRGVVRADGGRYLAPYRDRVLPRPRLRRSQQQRRPGQGCASTKSTRGCSRLTPGPSAAALCVIDTMDVMGVQGWGHRSATAARTSSPAAAGVPEHPLGWCARVRDARDQEHRPQLGDSSLPSPCASLNGDGRLDIFATLAGEEGKVYTSIARPTRRRSRGPRCATRTAPCTPNRRRSTPILRSSPAGPRDLAAGDFARTPTADLPTRTIPRPPRRPRSAASSTRWHKGKVTISTATASPTSPGTPRTHSLFPGRT